MLKPNIIEKSFNFTNCLSERKATNRIIIHHTGGADIDAYAEQIHKWHINAGYSGIGYHFVIRKNGDIERGRPILAVGSHAYGANSDSVGIHLSGDFTYNLPTDNQIESAALLIAYLCEFFNIPTDRKHILGHRETIETACPGNMLFNLLDVIVGKANWYRFNNADIVDYPAEPPDFHFKPRAGMLSEHFSEKEFACPCCGVVNVNPKLIELLERLRWNIGGYPLYIYSGCRCKIFNTNYGGKLDSQHLLGNAADIAYPKQLSFGEFKWYIEQLPFDAIGINLDFIHVDIRNGGVGSKLFLLGGVDND